MYSCKDPKKDWYWWHGFVTLLLEGGGGGCMDYGMVRGYSNSAGFSGILQGIPILAERSVLFVGARGDIIDKLYPDWQC